MRSKNNAVSRSLCPGILRLLGSHRNMIAVDACHEPQGKKEHGILRSVGSRDEDSRSRELAASASLDSSRPRPRPGKQQSRPMMNKTWDGRSTLPAVWMEDRGPRFAAVCVSAGITWEGDSITRLLEAWAARAKPKAPR